MGGWELPEVVDGPARQAALRARARRSPPRRLGYLLPNALIRATKVIVVEHP